MLNVEDERTKQLIADPDTESYSASKGLGVGVNLSGWALPLIVIAIVILEGGPLDAFGTGLLVAVMFGFAAGAAWLTRKIHAAVAHPLIWIGPRGVWDRRVMNRALSWDEIDRARETTFKTGRFNLHRTIAIDTQVAAEMSRIPPKHREGVHKTPGPIVRAPFEPIETMPEMPVTVSRLRTPADEIIAAFDRYCTVEPIPADAYAFPWNGDRQDTRKDDE